MTPERWKQIEEIFQSAVERSPRERVAYVAEACGSDAALLDEVEALIASYDEAGDFIEEPAFDVPRHISTETTHESLVGITIAHYDIVSTLGVGGMGEVYLAHDRRLDRKVALKLLSREFTRDETRLQRFEQEARITSALSHPNVCIIYEVGETEEGLHYIAMEHVEGQTLRHLMTGEPMEIGRVLDTGSQIAAALVAAHGAGIMHRDIKPENIMVRADGHVKVLDFGLAKLTERPAGKPNAPTLITTDPNMIMGTPRYMSPEQVRGMKVDARTDIWSLGVVLYEMLTGRVPFDGASTSEVIVSILEYDPPSLSRVIPGVPEALEMTLAQALRKDREERYQSVKELFADLRSLKRQRDFAAEERRYALPAAGNGATRTKSTPRDQATTPGRAAAGPREAARRHRQPPTQQQQQPAPLLSGRLPTVHFFLAEVRHRPLWLALVLAVVVGLVGLAGLTLYSRFLASSEQTRAARPDPFQKTKVARLTANGTVNDVAISPDGKYIVYALEESGRQGLWVRQVAIASNVRIAPAAEVEYQGITFSPDGTYVYYVVSEKNNLQRSLYQVSVLGGNPRKVLSDVGGAVSFSPDGRQMAFVRRSPEKGEDALVVIPENGGAEERLATRKYPNSFDWDVAPAWSPDGQMIACVARNSTEPGSYMSIVGVKMKGGEEPISPVKWQWIGQMAWLKAGDGLVLSAKDEDSSFQQIWHVPYPQGEPHRITNDFSDYTSVSLTADASTIATVREDLVSHIWLCPPGDPARATQVTPGPDRYYDLSWTPEGRMIYASDVSGSAEIWQIEADGSGQKQLTTGVRRNYGPKATPDGRYVVLHSNRSGNWNIWRMNADGSDPKQLTFGADDSIWPTPTPDGQWILYQHLSAGTTWTIWKVPIDGGAPMQLTGKLSGRPAVSPDGRWVACWYNEGQSDSQWRLALVPTDGGAPVKTYAVPPTVAAGLNQGLVWMPDGRAITYIDTRGVVANIWVQPLDGGKPGPLTDFKSERIFAFDWLKDGRLALSRGVMTSDVVMIKDSR